MINMKVFDSREAWLEARGSYIGGSDAAAVLGLNPYKTNVALWENKTGRKPHEDLSDKPYIKYGTEAEEHLRNLFALDYPEYDVCYEENNMWLNDMYPWGHYSADGWLIDPCGRFGVLEIKTTEILRAGQKQQWDKRVPQNYYIQLLHGFAITGAQFAVLKGQLKYNINGEMWLHTKHYEVERSVVENDINYLMQKEKEFWKNVQEDREPNLILPSI